VPEGETLLGKVRIESERLSYPAFPHLNEAGAIHHAQLPSAGGQQRRHCQGMLAGIDPSNLNCRKNIILEKADRRNSPPMLQQRTRFHHNVVCSDQLRVAGKQEIPLFSRFCMIGVVTVQYRAERGHIHEDRHDPNASERYRSCSALTSLEPDAKRPAAARARLR